MRWQNSRVVVTGGAGFLGRHLCRELANRGSWITIVDDFSYSDTDGLTSENDRIQLINQRLGDPAGPPDFGGEWDVLFHLAAVADPRACRDNFDLAFQTNIVGTKSVLSSWQGQGRVIFLSSAAVYGDPEYVPIDESHPLKGNDPYAITKIMGEQLSLHYGQNSQVPITVVRNFNTFGPGQSRAYLIPTLISQALNENAIELWNPRPVRDFCYVSNTVEALLAIAENEATVGMTLNVGGGEGIRVGDLAEKIGAQFNVPVVDLKKQVTGSENLVCNNQLLRETTGWSPAIDIDEGLKLTTEYWREIAGEPGLPQ